MPNIKIIKETPITMAQVKEELMKNHKKEENLNFRANKTYSYLQEFVTLSSAKAKELKEKIESLNIPRLKEEHIVKIIDTMPKHAEEVKILLSGYTITVSQESAKKIADAVSEFI